MKTPENLPERVFRLQHNDQLSHTEWPVTKHQLGNMSKCGSHAHVRNNNNNKTFVIQLVQRHKHRSNFFCYACYDCYKDKEELGHATPDLKAQNVGVG